MSGLTIDKNILAARKARGMTQEALAEYLGVSKAAVSKWETGQSFPDILLLPAMATLFNMHIDDLLGYKPQMEKSEIRRLYHKLATRFAEEPMPVVLRDCREILREYYACFPLLLQMATLYLNHLEFAPDQELRETLLSDCLTLTERILEECTDYGITYQAAIIRGSCLLAVRKPAEVVELLEGRVIPSTGIHVLLSAAEGMLGKPQKADEILQVGMYNHLIELMGCFPAYLMNVSSDILRFEEGLQRALAIAKAFDLDHLHVAVMFSIYLTGASGYAMQKKEAACYGMLERYAALCQDAKFPLILHGDAFFDGIEPWLRGLDLGQEAPRDIESIRVSAVDAVMKNPAFEAYQDHPHFKGIIEKIKGGFKHVS